MPNKRDAMEAWRRAGPLSLKSQRLLDEVEAARAEGRVAGTLWVDFLRSLTPRQQRAVLGLIDHMEDDGTLIA